MAVQWHDQAFLAAAERGAARGAFMAAHLVHDEAVRLITSGPKTGRLYRRRGVTHQASAPGEAPASDSGQLAQSGNVQNRPGEAAATVSFSTIYARSLELGSAYKISAGGFEPDAAAQLEFGTQSLAPRPFLRPALANMGPQIVATIAAEIRFEIGAAGGNAAPIAGRLS